MAGGLQRLIDGGFTDATEVGRSGSKSVVRAYHPDHGWMYERITDGDNDAMDAWAAKASVKIVDRKSMRVGAKK